MNKLWNVFLAMSKTMLLSIAGVIALLVLMLYQLQSLTPGVSESELATRQSTETIGVIIENPVQAPYKMSVFLTTKVFNSVFGLRLVGALLGVLAVIIFFLLTRQIFDPLVSIATTAMFATSSYFLVMTRSATANVMLLSLWTIVAVGYYIRFGKRKDLGWITAALVLGTSLYVPGMILFLLPLAIWQFPHAKKSFERLHPSIIIITSVIFGILCVPLLVGVIRQPSLWREYLGLPNLIAPVLDMVKHSATAVMSIFVRSPKDPSVWLGRQPILDVFATATFAYGIVALIKQFRLDRFWLIGGILALGVLWVGITANRYGIILLLPFIYLVIGHGLQLLIQQWRSVFPKNPIARYTGVILLVTVIIAAMNFQLHRYFVAWSHSDETKQALQAQLPDTNTRQ